MGDEASGIDVYPTELCFFFGAIVSCYSPVLPFSTEMFILCLLMFAVCNLQQLTVKSGWTFKLLGFLKTVETSKVKLGFSYFYVIMCVWGHGIEGYGLKVICLCTKFTMNGVVMMSVNCHTDRI